MQVPAIKFTCPGRFLPTIFLTLCLSSACAGSGGQPEVKRSDPEALLGMLSCPDNQKPVCEKRMGTVTDCFCRTSADFRKLHEDSLKKGGKF